MKIRLLILVILLSLSLPSCISTKRTTYLQDDKELAGITQVTMKQAPYKVQVNDILNINIKAENQELVSIFKQQATNPGQASVSNLYFNGFTVDNHGNIRIPVLGEVNVLGYTLEEIRKEIESKLLSDYLTAESYLFVDVKLAGLNFTVMGEIGSPGNVTLFQDQVNILEAVANAGDIRVTGNRKDVVIIRQYPDGKKIHHVDLTSVDLLESPYFFVMPNDIIYIKPLKQKAWGTGTTGLQTFNTLFSVFSIITSTILIVRSFN